MNIAKLSDFKPDAPWGDNKINLREEKTTSIDGLLVTPLINHGDHRGYLTELLTNRDQEIEPIVHVYQVHAAPGSIRGWVYHNHQLDRLTFTEGEFSLVLCDIRENSKTHGEILRLDIGKDNPCMVTIPKQVAHLLRNSGNEMACFVNLPTRAFDLSNPDKSRLPYPDSRIPFEFDD